jgi:uncharacterized membrane protein
LFYSEFQITEKADLPVGELTEDTTLEQTFVCPYDNLERVSIFLATYNRHNSGQIKFTLLDSGEEKIIYSEVVNTKWVNDNAYQELKFTPIHDSKGKKFAIILNSIDSKPGKSITAWMTKNKSEFAKSLSINHNNLEGSLLLKLAFYSSCSFFLVFLGLLTLTFISLFVRFDNLVLYLLHKPAITFVTFALPIGLLLVFLTPPFQVPDEFGHLKKSYDTAKMKLLPPKNNFAERWIINCDEYSNKGSASISKILKNSKDLMPQFIKDNYSDIATPCTYPPNAYFFSGLAVYLGLKTQLSTLLIMYLARIFNLFAWIMIVFFLIRLVPVLKWSFVVIALLPMTVFEAASVSGDGITISCTLLLIAYLLKYIYDDDFLPDRVNLSLFILLSMQVSLCKYVYCPIILLLLCVPAWKFKGRLRQFFISIGILAISIAPALLWLKISPHLPAIAPNAEPTKQLAFILQSPFRLVFVFLTSFWHYGYAYWNMTIGILGPLTVALPNWLYKIYFGLLILLIFFIESSLRVSFFLRTLSFLLTVAVCFVLMSFFYIIWTTPGKNIIDGMQGRYLIPLLPLLFITFAQSWIQVSEKVKNSSILILLTVVLTAQLTAIHSLWSYYWQ